MPKKIYIEYEWPVSLKLRFGNIQAVDSSGLNIRDSSGNLRAIFDTKGVLIGNASIGSATSANWVVGIRDGPAPSVNPSQGVWFFSESGVAKVKQPNGAITRLGPALGSVPVTVTYAATIAFDASLSDTFRVTMTGNSTFNAPTNPTDGQRVQLELTASGADRTPTFTVGSAGAFKFGSDITAVTPIVAGTTDLYGLKYNAAADRWWIVAYVKGY